jgi:hypothetical protein
MLIGAAVGNKVFVPTVVVTVGASVGTPMSAVVVTKFIVEEALAPGGGDRISKIKSTVA